MEQNAFEARNKKTEAEWRTLYRMGGAAPFIAIVFYLSQITLIFVDIAYPTTAEGWFDLFLKSRFFGLFVINALDIFSIAFLGLMFLALYIALRDVNRSFMTIGAFFAFLGVAVFVTARADIATAWLELTDQLAAAATEAQWMEVLTAGRSIMALTRATPETAGFLFMAFGSFIFSFVILRDGTFGKWIGYLGIVAFIATLANDISLIAVSTAEAIFMPINGMLWFIWWVAVGIKLLRLGKDAQRGEK